MITTRRVVGSVLLATVLAVVLYGGLSRGPTPAEATLPGACPAASGGGTVGKYVASAILPVGAGANANGVCIDLSGTGGTNASGAVILNPSGCAGPTAGAGSSKVWADWGASNCVAPGGLVKIAFKNGGSLPAGTQVGAATWSLAGGGTIVSDVTVELFTASVGGVAGEPDQGAVAAASDASGGTSIAPYAAGGGAVAFVLLASVLTGLWYARRRGRAG